MYATVIIPTKNRLPQTINAVMSAFEIPDVDEVIIVDDGSIFALNEYLKCLDQKYKLFVKVFHNQLTHGAQGARITGLIESKNEIVIFLDSDDLLIKDGVQLLLDVMASNHSIALSYGNTKFGGNVSNWLRLEGQQYLAVLRNLSLCPFSGLVVRKTLINWGDLIINLPAWQDDDFCLLASRAGHIYFVDTVVAENNLSPDSISRSKEKQFIGLAMLLDRHKPEIMQHFGLRRIFLWRVRQLALLFQVMGGDCLSCSHTAVAGLKFIFLVQAFIFNLTARIIQLIMRPFFDRIYT